MLVLYRPDPSARQDLTAVAESARQSGFTAVELTADDRADASSVTNLLWSSPAAIAKAMVGLTVGSVQTPGGWRSINRGIAAAASVGCHLVRVTGADLSTSKCTCKLARDTGDFAAARGVVVAIEPADTRHGVTALWTFLDAVGHPEIGCCWAPVEAALFNVSIPVLSNWIRAARITGTDRGPIDRLHGIGFQGPWIVRPSPDGKGGFVDFNRGGL